MSICGSGDNYRENLEIGGPGRPEPGQAACRLSPLAAQWQTGGVPAPLSILVALGIIACLAIVLRWTYGQDSSDQRYPAPLPTDDEPAELAGLVEPDYGLLRSVVVTIDPDHADLVRLMLAQGGIRSTTARRPNGPYTEYVVLVFGDQLDQARRLVG